MRRARLLLGFGIWIAVLPYLGFPIFWKNMLFSLTGLILAYFSFVIYREYMISIRGTKKKFDTFSENRDFEAQPTETYGERN